MEVKIKCPWCDQEYTVDSSFVGQTVKCEICEKDFKARNDLFNPLPTNSNQKKKPIHSSSNSNKNPPSKKSFWFDQGFEAPNSNKNPPSPKKDNARDNAGWKWIADFFDFKIMVTPFLVRVNFLFLFIGGTIAIIILPFNYTWEKIDTPLFILLYFIYLVITIPLLALTLHAFYEWTMIPFSILDVLKEIREKLDEKAKS